MAKPPKTPPDDAPEPQVPKSDELKREEADPAEIIDDVQEKEKGRPPDSQTPYN